MKSFFLKTLIVGTLVFGGLLLKSCVEPYKESFQTANKIIIVEGTVANETGLRPILLKESLPSETGSINVLPIIGAKVSVVVNGSTTVNLTEIGEARYYFPATFKGEIGSSYQLKFTTPDGNSFESKPETIEAPVDIQSVYHQLDPKAITDAKGNSTAGYKLYVDLNDPAGKANQYIWEWTLYEKQNTCQTCTGAYYYRTVGGPNGSCVDDAILKRSNNVFDYVCETGCWEIVRSSELAANNDDVYDGKTIKQYIGKMPIYQYSGALLEVEQLSVSKQAYNFIRLSQKQGIETGGLADTPPAALVGNIVCTNNPSANTSGFFVVAGRSRSRYWLDKKDLQNTGIPAVGLLGGRATRYEPSGNSTTRPPQAPCINSLNRTSTQPVGWIN